ncbi:MAG: phosphoribosylglycinamide formyltransferase [Chloroflexota bacterium]|nr:phosphoribosylglycinamide formyltransferase [Chloroflexota bacterium]
MRGLRRPRLAVLISGSGRTLANLIAASESGVLDADIVVVVSSKAGVRGLEIAAEAGIPAVVVTRNAFPDDATYSAAIYQAIAPYEPDLAICAGFLKRLVVPAEWVGRILNIHPALIPESAAAGTGFYGLYVHAAVIASGAEESGATVHVVDDEYDHGPVVEQQRVPVLPGDTPESLAARVFAAECELYPRAIGRYLRERSGLTDRVADEG